MRKTNRIMMKIVSILLCLVLITTSILSGVFAKYVTKQSADVDGAFKKWGISITPDSDLSETYGTLLDGDSTFNLVSSTSGNVLAPGTKGALAAFHVEGNPEVRYDINFTGSITIGDGYKASSHFVNDELGRCIDYFPIILYLCKVELDSNDKPIDGTKEVLSKHCVVRLSPDAPAGVTTTRNNDSSDTIVDGEYTNDIYRYSFFDTYMWSGVSVMQAQLNAAGQFFDAQFDSAGLPNDSINCMYTVEWDWPYNNEVRYEGDSSRNGNYQTRELDTQLGEAMAKNKGSNLFDIKLDMSVTVEQAKKPYTREGDRITFGSYPQSAVEDATLKATLDGLTSNIEKWNYYQPNYQMKPEYAIEYVDVKNGSEKYRGVKVGGGTEIFWFKYDPIVWIVLAEKEGKAFLVSEKLLDQRKYQDDFSGNYNTSEGVPANTYASNWEYSTIRKWLNETFYETAFNKSQSLIVLTTEVDNSASTTKSGKKEFASTVKTQDKVFLLSYKEVIGEGNNQYGSTLKNIFLYANDDNTAYSRKIYDETQWRTRSPESATGISVIYGYDNTENVNSWKQSAIQCNMCKGVRPALWIEL